MAESLEFYLDENIELAVAEQLKRRGIDVVTVLDLGLLGDSDQNHLTRAAAMKRVLCTYDFDFVAMASRGIDHHGIVVGISQTTTIGEWVRFLEVLNKDLIGEEMLNVVRYVPKG